MKNAIESRQAARNGLYEAEYKTWAATADPETKKKLKELGLMKPESGYMVSKGSGDDEILARQVAPVVDPESELKEGERVADSVSLAEGLRIALCDILNPLKGSTMEYEAQIVGLAIGSLGLGGISQVARRFGVGRQAVSKRVIKFCNECGLPPSVYMRSEKNREIHRLANVRKKKGLANG